MDDQARGKVHEVQVYYEDTDHSGVVYHANYLKYFERAREHVLGVALMLRMTREDGIGFAVYQCEVTFLEGAVFGDTLCVRTTIELESDYRLRFHHVVTRKGEERVLCRGRVDMVCLDAGKQLTRVPSELVARMAVD